MRVRLALIPLALAATLLAGCASKQAAPASTPTPTPTPALADLTADQILAKAQAALKSTTSFHIKSTSTQDGTQVKADFIYAGDNATGTFEAAGFKIEVFSVGGKELYVRAPAPVWGGMLNITDSSKLAALLNKWVKVDRSAANFKDLAGITDKQGLLTPEGTASKGEAKSINGTAAIGLIDSKDKSVIYIATQGEPYPVRGEGPGADVIDFSEFNTAAEVKVPTAAEIIDLKTITG